MLRLILPQASAAQHSDGLCLTSEQKDRERAVYGLREKNLAKTYIRLIPLGMKDPDSVRMLNWKKPTERNVPLCS